MLEKEINHKIVKSMRKIQYIKRDIFKEQSENSRCNARFKKNNKLRIAMLQKIINPHTP